MLLKTQRSDAEQLVKEGKPFPAELAAAVLAAVDEIKAAHDAVLFQCSDANQKVVKYESERQETQRLRIGLEDRIDQRVQARTAELEEKRRDAVRRVALVIDERNLAYEECSIVKEQMARKAATDRRLIDSLRQLVCDKFSPKLFSRIAWKSKAKKVLYEVQDYHPVEPVGQQKRG